MPELPKLPSSSIPHHYTLDDCIFDLFTYYDAYRNFECSPEEFVDYLAGCIAALDLSRAGND